MKRLFCVLLLIFLLSSQAMAAGVCTQEFKSKGAAAEVIFTCVGDAVAGSIPDTNIYEETIQKLLGFYPYRIVIVNLAADANVDPNSDVYLRDEWANDILNGQGVDQLDDSAANYIRLNQYDPVVGTLTLSVANQTAASGKWYVTVIFVK